MDRYRDLRVGILECGFGWLPCWAKRMDEQVGYVGGTALLKHRPSDYLTSGRFFSSIEMHEGEDMFNCVTGFLGDNVLMYASDYPHSECHFPNSVDYVLRLVEPEAGDAAKAALGQRGAVLQTDLKRRHPARQRQRSVSRRVKKEMP